MNTRRRSHHSFLYAFYLGLFLVVYVLVIYFLITTRAHAHEAVSGWSYPFACCSDYDCREVPATDIGEGPEGYVIKGTGEVVGYQDTRVKHSPDGAFHWCSVAGKADGRTICLFVPPRSF